MGTLVRLPLADRAAPDLLEKLLDGMADGFNRLVDIGRADREATRVMVGYLSAGSIALRCNGLDEPADRFLATAAQIDRDWRCFWDSIRALAASFGRA